MEESENFKSEWLKERIDIDIFLRQEAQGLE